ncbi:hypothetical protein GCM10022261_09660 [Brevibacterium daeguense]|uniref:Uncharacterized protein n=1 Tax=Brevibacterium daeguense TaxID=909936 RepID=A0ABP8EHM1_9MICO|nr:hypothetical protein [Brevibacterium daeguense]
MVLPPPNPGNRGAADSPLSRLRPPRTGASIAAEAEIWVMLIDYRERAWGLVTEEQIAAGREAIRQARAEWAAVSPRLAGDAERWDAERTRRRESLQTRLREIVPEYGKLRELQTEGSRAVADRAFLRPPAFEPVIAPADPTPILHHPPFAQDRLGPIDSEQAAHTMDVVDRSFANREIGHLVIDVDLAVDPGGTWGFNEWFGLLPIDHGCASAACGTTFTLPEEGRLSVSAVLDNIYSRTSLSLSDKWGSSSGILSAASTVFVAVLQPDGGEVLHSTLAARKLESDGDDSSAMLPEIEQQEFRLLANTEGRFGAGETVFVLAGISVVAGSLLNDMKAHVRSLMWWELDELGISVVQ